MPSGNTNTMKQYIQQYNDIEKSFIDSFRIRPDDESINAFIDNCEGKYGIEQEIDSQEQALSRCEEFVHDLNLVLSTNQLKDDSKYREYIQTVYSYIREYEETISKLSDLLPYAG